ncbi:TSUP family transporter [Micromonospora sp. DT233]|uniref:TSUP family transporter n=1 Tax=Micromonospora sp. DT233 TaxID=3393432 RepID=UPI003CF502B1
MDAGSLGALLVVAALAGWVDAVVGGGGLLMLPALLVAGVPVATALGTNKVAAIAGTATAAVTYARRVPVDWVVVGPAAGLAVVTAGVGAALAGVVPASAYRPVVLVVLVLVAVFVVVRPGWGLVARPQRRTRGRVVAAVLVAGVGVAAYDGLIGPGTGTFLVVVFTVVVGADFVRGSAMAKVVNAGTNVGALVVFGVMGHVWWWLGAALAVCNVAGAVVGARMALRRGSGFVRVVLVTVVLVLVARLGFEQWVAG